VPRSGLAQVFALSALLAGACAPTTHVVRSRPREPFDVVVIPGCPSEMDGTPSYCQMGRAAQAALLWKDGWTRFFIVSGSDVHSPYVEAEAISQLMSSLGVPADRVFLERDALHTDENVYYSMLLAERLGLSSVAVASSEGAAEWMCEVMASWGHTCGAIGTNVGELSAYLPLHESELRRLRATRVQFWVDLPEREADIAKRNGVARPPSFLLYPFYRRIGQLHRPIAPAHPAPLTWRAREAELAGGDAGRESEVVRPESTGARTDGDTP
jgi:hypothetical protein